MSKNETTIYAPGLYDVVNKDKLKWIGKSVLFYNGKQWCCQLFLDCNYGFPSEDRNYYFPIAGAVMFGDAWIPEAIPLA